MTSFLRQNWEESAAIRETFVDDVIPETENWEESAAIREMFVDDVIPETENWEESAAFREMFVRQKTGRENDPSKEKQGSPYVQDR